MKYDLKDHLRSQNIILKFQNYPFLQYIYCLMPNLLKTCQECQHYEDTNLYDRFYAKIILAY